MPTIVGILDRDDRDGRTDILVLVNHKDKQILWLPRDLFIPTIANRINKAFSMGGHKLLQDAVNSLGFEAEESIVIKRGLCERFLSTLTVTVPVSEKMSFAYPLAPQLRTQDGTKTIYFNPPEEVLSGERIHQWIGARKEPLKYRGGDLDRIRRQQIFLRCVLKLAPDFSKMLGDGLNMSSENALSEIMKVESSWSFQTFDKFVSEKLLGMCVLFPLPEQSLKKPA